MLATIAVPISLKVLLGFTTVTTDGNVKLTVFTIFPAVEVGMEPMSEGEASLGNFVEVLSVLFVVTPTNHVEDITLSVETDAWVCT